MKLWFCGKTLCSDEPKCSRDFSFRDFLMDTKIITHSPILLKKSRNFKKHYGLNSLISNCNVSLGICLFLFESCHVYNIQLFGDQEGFCSDFRYESNGIFVLGVGFFFFALLKSRNMLFN